MDNIIKKGQNSKGVISKHRKGGHKRLYQQIDFRQNKKKSLKKITINYKV
jgi:ribosomal protein L2